MRADDDGFVNPKMVMRMMGSTDDELKVLIGKHFVLPFENGVVVIKHWRVNNLIRKDWYRPTVYVEQKAQLYLKANSSYTLDEKQGIPILPEFRERLGNEAAPKSVTTRPRSIGKDRLGKDRKIASAKRPRSTKPKETPTEEDPKPFVASETRSIWYSGKNATSEADIPVFQLLAWFFDKKSLWERLKSREQVASAVKRHIRAARVVIEGDFDKDDCEAALKRCVKDNPRMVSEWTIETLHKYLTK